MIQWDGIEESIKITENPYLLLTYIFIHKSMITDENLTLLIRYMMKYHFHLFFKKDIRKLLYLLKDYNLSQNIINDFYKNLIKQKELIDKIKKFKTQSESNALVMALNEHDFDWVFILDDDVYLYPPKVREIIFKYKDNHKVAIGTPGCRANKIVGFCGGGGYGFSRKVLEKLIGNDPNKFLKEYKEHCDGTQFCDITTADLLVKKGIKLIDIKEFKPWGIAKKDKHQINKNEVATLHYYGGELTNDYKKIPEKMNFLHKMFTKIK